MKHLFLISTLSLIWGPMAMAKPSGEFRAVGKLVEASSSHTNQHRHQLKFLRLSDGETFNIVDSPELQQAHCKTGKTPVVDVEGYQTDRFLFWGGNLVVTGFKTHDDIQTIARPHANEQLRGLSNSAAVNTSL